MKALFLTAAIMSAPAVAAVNEEGKFDTCEEYSEIAELIMTAHQRGRPMVEIVKSVAPISAGKQLVIMAYQEPRFNTEEFQYNQIAKFRDKIYMDCILNKR